MGITHPPTTNVTLSPLFGETTYPSLPREETESHLSHSDSGLTSPTAVTAPTSPTGAITDDHEEEMPTLRSRNPFLASIIARQQTPSTQKGLTSSGTHSRISTEKSSDQSESRHGNFNEQMSRPGLVSNTAARVRIWPITLPPIGAPPSTSEIPPTRTLRHEPTPTATGSYSTLIPVTDALTYGHKQRRRSDSSTSSSSPSHSDLTSASIERTTSNDS